MYSSEGPEAFGDRIFTFPDRVRTDLDLALDVQGTPLQLSVWDALRAIPIGDIVTYAEIARRAGAAGDRDAVAQACLSNRIALAIPCHRAIADDGDIGPYRWGVERKRVLLNFEALLRDAMS